MTPDALAFLRESLIDFLVTNPAARRLLARVRPPVPERSGTLIRHGDEDEDVEAEEDTGSGGRR
jgi:hypothetical protein